MFVIYSVSQNFGNSKNTVAGNILPANTDTTVPIQNNNTPAAVATGPQPAKPTPKPAPSSNSTPPTPVAISGKYKDGTYTGISADAYYGNVQVQIAINGGKITDVQFLDYPQDRRTSLEINSQAMPYLKTEAIQAQSAQVDIVSGATATSGAFQQSLASALSQAS